MDGNDVRAVAYGEAQQQYSWPVDADIICAFPTTGILYSVLHINQML